MSSARPSSARISSVCSPRPGEWLVSSAGVPRKRVGWRGMRVLPTMWWSSSTNRPMATACSSRVSWSGDRIIANGTRCSSNRFVACGLREVRRVRVDHVHDRLHDVAVLAPLRHGRDARVVPALDVERLAHALEVGVGGGRDDPPPVLEPHRLEAGDERRVLRTVGLEQHLVAGGVGPQERHHRVHHRQLEVLATVAVRPREQRRGDRLRRVERGDLVGRGLAQEHRHAAVGRVGLVDREPAVGLDHGVVRAAVAVRALGPEPGERRVDDVGVQRAAPRRSRARASPSRRVGSSRR